MKRLLTIFFLFSLILAYSQDTWDNATAPSIYGWYIIKMGAKYRPIYPSGLDARNHSKESNSIDIVSKTEMAAGEVVFVFGEHEGEYLTFDSYGRTMLLEKEGLEQVDKNNKYCVGELLKDMVLGREKIQGSCCYLIVAMDEDTYTIQVENNKKYKIPKKEIRLLSNFHGFLKSQCPEKIAK